MPSKASIAAVKAWVAQYRDHPVTLTLRTYSGATMHVVSSRDSADRLSDGDSILTPIEVAAMLDAVSDGLASPDVLDGIAWAKAIFGPRDTKVLGVERIDDDDDPRP